MPRLVSLVSNMSDEELSDMYEKQKQGEVRYRRLAERFERISKVFEDEIEKRNQSKGTERIKEEIRGILDNIYENGELEAGLNALKELGDYAS